MKLKHKAYFLGPRAENEAWVKTEFLAILEHWSDWRKGLFAQDPRAIAHEDSQSPEYKDTQDALARALNELNNMFKEELPTYPPRYLGHMVSELALPAILGHVVTLLHNPNNTTTEASRVGSRIENDLIDMLNQMIGYDPAIATGHITGGGTVANFEAIWRARFRQDHWLALALYLAEEKAVALRLFEAAHMGWDRFSALVEEYDIDIDDLRGYSAAAGNPYLFGQRMSRCFDTDYAGPVILVPGNKHFSWQKGTNLFGLGETAFWPIALDEAGKLDVASLRENIAKARKERRPILMVVSVAGTTETAEIDPVHEVEALLAEYKSEHGWDIWHHVDAAWGGFMCTMLEPGNKTVLTPQNERALRALGSAHSVTIDPHKLGYVPYACGAILTRDEASYTVSTFKAPYLDRQQGSGKHEKLERWSTTLEGSRPATGAAATWLTGRTLGFNPQGLGAIISDTILACRAFRDTLTSRLPFFHPLEPTDTNILCFSVAEDGDTLSAANQKTAQLYEAFHESRDLSVSKTTLHVANHEKMMRVHVATYGGTFDDDTLVLIRCVFMNPFWAEKEVADRLTEEFARFLEDWHKGL